MAEKKNNATYKVTIKTNADKVGVTAKAEVFLQLVGKGEIQTEWMTLTSFWRRRFRQGSIDDFELTLLDIGLPLLVRLKIESGEPDAIWGCDYVLITYNDETEEFPIYDWVTGSIEAVSGRAVLPQDVEEEFIRKSRKNEIIRNKLLYRWQDKDKIAKDNWQLPRQLDVDVYNELPVIFKYDVRYNERGNNKRKYADFKWNAILQKVKGSIFGINCLEDYHQLHANLEVRFSPFYDKWTNDEEFGRHMLDGSSKSIRRCRALPALCKVKNHHVSGLLNESFDEELVKGHIFIVDPGASSTRVTRNMIRGKSLYCPDAFALFYSYNKKFLPIAIQLDPHDEDSIFTPKDEKYDWLLAKMFFKCAEFNNHEHGTHFVTHVIIGSIAVALFRCLPRSHPIHKLLRPHLDLVMAANRRGMDFLYVDRVGERYRSQDSSDQSNETYKNFTFEDLNFPEKMRKRGLMDKEFLPQYYFRDDALLYWDAIDRFTAKMIDQYYKSDEDVQEDIELRLWMSELVHEGYAYNPAMKSTCPKKFETKKDLQHFATITIFTASVFHSSVHFPQYEMYKFIPNNPAGMRMPIHKKGEGSLERILATLPDLDMSLAQLGTSFMATSLNDNEVLLGQYPVRYFTEPDAISILSEFSDDVKEIGRIIRDRNADRERPYEYLLPENVTATITQ